MLEARKRRPDSFSLGISTLYSSLGAVDENVIFRRGHFDQWVLTKCQTMLCSFSLEAGEGDGIHLGWPDHRQTTSAEIR